MKEDVQWEKIIGDMSAGRPGKKENIINVGRRPYFTCLDLQQWSSCIC